MSSTEKIVLGGEHTSALQSPRPWLILFATVLLFAFFVSLLGKPGYALSVFGDLAELGFLLVAIAFMIRNAFLSHGATRIFWSFFAAGILLWIVGLLQWTEYELILRTPRPQTPIGDVLLFLKLVPLFAALAAEPHVELPRRFRIFGFLDLSFLLVYWFYFYAIWVIPYRYVEHEEGLYSFHFDAIDAIGHVLFIAALGMVALRAQGAWRTLYRLCFAAFALYGISSMLANVAIDEGKYYSGGPYDLPLLTSVAGIACFAVLGGTLPAQSAPSLAPGASTKPPRTLILLPARIAMLATLSTPVIGFAVLGSANVSYAIGHFRVLTTLLAMLLLTLLLSLKQDLLSSDLIRSLREASRAYTSLSSTHQRLLQTEKLASLGQVVARVANEVKKAMTAALNASSTLILDAPPGSNTRSMMDKIVTQSNRTDALVNSMLSFACESPLEIVPVDLYQLLSAAIGLARVGRNSRLRMQIKSEGTIPRVAADSSRILQVCLQIISNAVEAMEHMDSGTLLITLRNIGQSVEVEFADTGIGLQDPERVFDPFYTTKEVGKGIGLGLSTCYGIVRQHHGDITCRNGLSGGAVFTVTLPVFSQESSLIALPVESRVEEA
ncbi:MAG TPA: ATP-binding protein [Candidatus Acidoferrum sp.]|nr:ATP-binding protein [Candidatus Acidoferrum sp.]